jgi:uncharacterized protein YndB with AHSA1/START domain
MEETKVKKTDTRKGVVTREAEGFKVVFERTLSHDIQTVWDAITNPEKLKIWFTDFEMDFKEGGDMKIKFRDADKTVTSGKIISIDPPNKFVWMWETELAVWELTSEGKGKCKLVLTYSKMDDKYAVGASGGFHTILDRLELALNGKKESYQFGTEENDPQQIELREIYGNIVYEKFPELQVHHPYKIERIYKATIQKVWKALTENELLKQWYFDFLGGFKAEVGHEFDWHAGPPDGEQWHHHGKIFEVVPGKKLVHSWEYPGYTGKANVIWELSEVDANTTKLNFTFEFAVPFDPTEEPLKRRNFVEGWKQIVNTGLKEFVEK